MRRHLLSRAKGILSLSATILSVILVGCTSTEGDTDNPAPVPTPPDETVPQLSIEINRHGDSPTINTFHDGDCVGLFAAEGGEKGEQVGQEKCIMDNLALKYDAGQQAWTSTPEIIIQELTSPLDIVAYYPYMALDENLTIDFSVRTDQSNASTEQEIGGFEASDLLWCRADGITPANEGINLKMDHVMAKVKVTLLKGEGWSDDEWESVEKSVQLTGTITDLKFDIATCGITLASESKPQPIDMLRNGNEFSAFAAPQQIEVGSQIFKAVVDGIIYRQIASPAIELKSGHYYSLSMTINKKGENPYKERLSGKVIGSRYSVDYATSQPSEKVNTKSMVFDGDLTTFFASYDRSRTWVGLDLGEKHVISRIGYAPRPNESARLLTAIIEGANSADFSDAIPIHIIKQQPNDMEVTYADIDCSRGFRYVRFVSANDKRCSIAELEFYGVPDEGDDSQLYQLTNLPTVVINTENAADITSKEVEINSTVYVIWEDGTEIICDTETGVRGRGNASWGFPKKPYRLKFSKKRSPLGAPAKAKKWTLISNYSDKSLLRNILAFEVSRRVGLEYTPYCHPVDLILNGEYKGCYQLCDQIEVGEERVDITEMEPTDVDGDNLKGGYLIEIDAYAASEVSMFYSSRGTPVTIKSPDDDEIVAAQSRYIEEYFNTMEDAVFANNYTDPDVGYRKYLDLDSFLRFFITGEFAGNTDTYWSVYMYKDRTSDKFVTGPIWDYDLAFDNDSRTYPIRNLPDFIYNTTGSVASSSVRSMVTHIVKSDSAAKARLIELWEQARANGIDVASLHEYIDRTVEMLDESQRLNFIRWQILNERVHQNPQALGSYEAEVGTVRKYVEERVDGLDRLLRK